MNSETFSHFFPFHLHKNCTEHIFHTLTLRFFFLFFLAPKYLSDTFFLPLHYFFLIGTSESDFPYFSDLIQFFFSGNYRKNTTRCETKSNRYGRFLSRMKLNCSLAKFWCFYLSLALVGNRVGVSSWWLSSKNKCKQESYFLVPIPIGVYDSY